jgi:predicted ATP-grasp superfamily ATP-dependent carboligase
MAMLRLPTRRSRGRANLHQGALGVGVDLQRGTTTHAVLGNRSIDVHPDSGAPLRGARVPCWEPLLELARRAAQSIRLGYVGVDLCLDRSRGPLVIEINARPGLNIQLANLAGLRVRLTAPP